MPVSEAELCDWLEIFVSHIDLPRVLLFTCILKMILISSQMLFFCFAIILFFDKLSTFVHLISDILNFLLCVLFS